MLFTDEGVAEGVVLRLEFAEGRLLGVFIARNSCCFSAIKVSFFA